MGGRPQLSGECNPCWGVGGWMDQRPTILLPDIDLQFPAPFDKYLFFPEGTFSDVGGWEGQGQRSRASIPPPPSPGGGKPWPGRGAWGRGSDARTLHQTTSWVRSVKFV